MTMLKVIGERGHYRPDAQALNHFLGECDECDARYLVHMTLAQVESWGPNGEAGKAGAVRQAMFEAYMHVWATGAVRFSSLADGWRAEPLDPEVNELVAEIRKAAEEKKEMQRA